MASGFRYTCSQFLSALQFPSLSLQVQEVSRQLRDPSVRSEDVVSLPESTPSSRPAPSHALKLFLSGCECEEIGAVEASCWGLRRLHEDGHFTAQELVPELQTKLTSCLHHAPLISLMADLLLLTDSPTTKYNLHTHQHPLAVAFSLCPDSVVCSIFCLLSGESAQQALRMLWSCLLHVLIHPQLSHHRTSLTSSLLEVAALPISSGTVSSPLLRLLLLSAVYSDDTSTTISMLQHLLDFSISYPALSPLSDVISISFNFLTRFSAPNSCSLLLHKLKTLFSSQPHLLSGSNTVPWLAISLLSPSLSPLSTQLADMTQLLMETSQQDSLSLLIFPLLAAQLNLERIRPDVSSRYSTLSHTLLCTPKTSQRGSGSMGQLTPEESVLSEAGVYLGDFSLFSLLSTTLHLCHTCLLRRWCEDTTLSLSHLAPVSPPPPLLSCIACSLLMEFTSPHSSAYDPLTLRLLLQLIALLVRNTPSLSPPLIACLMLAMDRCPYPEEAALTLHTLSTLSTHPACTLLLLRSLLSLSDTPSLLPPLLRAVASLWKQHDAVFPHLKQLIQLHTPSSPDWHLARALSVLDVCRGRAAVHGEEMLPLVTELISSRDSSLFVYVGMSALVSLVEAGAVGYTHSLDLLYAAVGTRTPPHWESSLSIRATQLLRHSVTQLDLSSKEHDLVCICVQQLLSLLSHSDQQVQAATVSALSDMSPHQLMLLEPFSPHLRKLLSIPDYLDLSPDKRCSSQFGSLFSLILKIDFSPGSGSEGSSALSQLLSHWLEEELDSCSTVFPREHRQEAERGEAALRSTAKLLTGPLPKLKPLTELSDSFRLSPHNAVSILFMGRRLWEQSEAPEKLSQHYLKLLSLSLSYPLTPHTDTPTPSHLMSFLVFIRGVQLFMRDVIWSTISSPSSPIEFLFSLLERVTSSHNPQGVMWLLTGLALNIRELHSSALQSAIQNLTNSLISACLHLFPSTDTYAPPPASQTMSFSLNPSAISGVAYLCLGTLGGVMAAYLKQEFSANTLNLYIRVWNASQRPSHHLDALYALTLSSILRAREALMLEDGPPSRKLVELSKRCTQQIQETRYPSQYAYLFLIDDVTLIRRTQQDSLNSLTSQDTTRSLEVPAINCSVLTCRLYSLREISLMECDRVISTYLKLSTQTAHNSSLQVATGILLSHTASYGHVPSQLLLHKTLTQLRSLLQQTPPDQFTAISTLLHGIFALLGAFQPLLSDPHSGVPPPTPSHYSILQQGVRTLLDHISPAVDKEGLFSHFLLLLGYIYQHYSQYSATIRTPSSSSHLPDNIILTPLFSFIEQSLYSGAIHSDCQRTKFETIFEVLANVTKPLPSYPWINLITCFQRSSEHDGIHSSLLRLLFRFQTRASEQEHLQITSLLRHWLLDPTLCLERLGTQSRRVVAVNLAGLFNSNTDPSALKHLLRSLIQDSNLFYDILEGLIKLFSEQDTTNVEKFKRHLLTASLESMLHPSFSPQLFKPESISLIDNCLSKLTQKEIGRLIPQDGNFFLLLRIYLFNFSHDCVWLVPCIPYLLDQNPLTSLPPSALHDALVQLSFTRKLSNDIISQVCLEVLNFAKSTLQTHCDSTPSQQTQKQSTLVFNTLFILSLLNPEISRMSGMLLLTARSLYPKNTPLNSDLSFYFSNITHAIISSSLSEKEHKLQIPLMKKLDEFLILFTQLLEDCNHSIPITPAFSFLAHIRQVEDVTAIRPWVLFGQAVLVQSKHLLK